VTDIFAKRHVASHNRVGWTAVLHSITVRLNVICLGYHEIGLAPPGKKRDLGSRAAAVEEIRGLDLWLLSDLPNQVTGQIIVQDAGVCA